MIYLGTTLIPTVDSIDGKIGDFTVGNGIDVSDGKVIDVVVDTSRGINVDSDGIFLKTLSTQAVGFDANGNAIVKVDTTKGIKIDSNGKVYADIDTTNGLKFNDEGALYVAVDKTKGLKVDSSSGIQINNGNGLEFATADASGNQALKVKAGTGIVVDSNGVSADIVTAWEATTSDTKIPSEKLVKDEIDDVREIAEGKTKTVVTNITQMPSLAVQTDSVTVTEVKDQEGTVVMNTTTLLPNYGDVVYVVETDYPDRWVSAINYSGTTCTGFVLSKLETAKVPVTDVKVDNTTIIANTVADLGTTGSLTGGTAYDKTNNPVATKAYVDTAVSSAGHVDDVKVNNASICETDSTTGKKTAKLVVNGTYDPNTNKIADMTSVGTECSNMRDTINANDIGAGTITLKDGDTSLGSFSANEKSAKSVDLGLSATQGFVKSKVMTDGHKVLSVWQGTQAEYNALATKDATCVYIITARNS